MRRAAAARRRLLICQNLGGQLPHLPLPLVHPCIHQTFSHQGDCRLRQTHGLVPNLILNSSIGPSIQRVPKQRDASCIHQMKSLAKRKYLFLETMEKIICPLLVMTNTSNFFPSGELQIRPNLWACPQLDFEQLHRACYLESS